MNQRTMYPSLSLEQLKALEEELVAFLIVHGIDGETWSKINAQTPQKAEELVGLFTRTVWDKIADQTEVLKRISENESTYVKIGDNDGFLITVRKLNHQIMVHTGTKKITENRRQEILGLFSQGFERASPEEFAEVVKNFLPEKSV
ncbi:MAG: hypothetical protein EBV19_04530 [Flavobacteriia bacterium]|nr:hypothetical protein [Flavobacteriia bacterium]